MLARIGNAARAVAAIKLLAPISQAGVIAKPKILNCVGLELRYASKDSRDPRMPKSELRDLSMLSVNDKSKELSLAIVSRSIRKTKAASIAYMNSACHPLIKNSIIEAKNINPSSTSDQRRIICQRWDDLSTQN